MKCEELLETEDAAIKDHHDVQENQKDIFFILFGNRLIISFHLLNGIYLKRRRVNQWAKLPRIVAMSGPSCLDLHF